VRGESQNLMFITQNFQYHNTKEISDDEHYHGVADDYNKKRT
jgi:hypothetical protein